MLAVFLELVSAVTGNMLLMAAKHACSLSGASIGCDC